MGTPTRTVKLIAHWQEYRKDYDNERNAFRGGDIIISLLGLGIFTVGDNRNQKSFALKGSEFLAKAVESISHPEPITVDSFSREAGQKFSHISAVQNSHS